MPRNGSGTYVPTAGQPVVAGTTISDVVFNTLVADLGNALTTSVATDGQTPMAANLPMGNNRLIGLAAAVAESDAPRLDQVVNKAGDSMSNTLTIDTTAVDSLVLTLKNTVGNGAAIQMTGNGATTPSKIIRVRSGALEVVNDANSAILASLTDAGSLQINCAGNPSVPIAAAFIANGSFGGGYRMIDGAAQTMQWMQAGVWNYGFGSGGAFTSVATLTSAGTFTAVTLTQTSDERKKKKWQRLPADFIKQLAGIRKSGLFQWKKDGSIGLGVGAQSLEAFLSAAVHTDAKGNKTVNYGAAAMVSAVELARKVEELETRLAALEGV